ncbi:MAG: cytochrome c biogenesis CcdA family protein [bacterium]
MAMAGGILSFLSPCVLPLVPGYLSYISGYSVESLKNGERSVKRTIRLLWQTGLFVLGFTVVFMILGGAMGWLGQSLLSYRRPAEIVGGALVIGFGVFLSGLYRPEFLMREFRPQMGESSSGSGSILMGMSFGLGWTPCVGPILGAILTLAGMEQSAGQGALLLFVYSMSLGVPFLLSALLVDLTLAGAKRIGPWLEWLERTGGVVLIGVGVLIMTGQFTLLALWLTRAFPFLLNFG